MNKKLLLFVLFMLLFVSFVSADICQTEEVLNGLRKALYVYYTNPSGSAFTEGELKNLLTFYIGISSGQITVECSSEQKSKIDIAKVLPDSIPSCGDGTKYGKCSSTKPMYCYASNLVPRCRLCGCPEGQMCDTTYVYTEKGNKGQWGKCNPGNVVCSINSDCGINAYIGDYYCENGDVYRERITHFCVGDELVVDDVLEVEDELVIGEGAPYCYNSTPSVLIDDCEVNETCIEGQSECQSIISDGPPTVAITVTPTTVVQGQLFNVTVIGTDDVGLNMIWWWGSSTGDAELNKAHMYNCNSAKFCTYSWLVSTNATGTLKLEANSRDTTYANLLACQKGLPECTCPGDITKCPGYGEPHQASEGAGIAYATVTVASAAPVSNLTQINGTITIKGRLINYFTQQPISNAVIFTWDTPTSQRLVYSNANGEFSITADTANVTFGNPKPFGISPSCYQNMGFAIFRNSDNSLYVNVQIDTLIGSAKSFQVTSSEVNVGDIPMWPAVDIAVYSDVPVQFRIEYSGITGSGNIYYKTAHYLSYSFPLNVDAKVKLTDSIGNIYYSPSLNLPLSHGCTPVTLNFSNNQFNWVGFTQINQTTCTDSDNGYDFYKYGEVKDITGSIYKDTCITDLSGLSEFVCGSDGLYSSQFHSCVNENKICSQGACVASAGNSWCYDPDGGYKFDEYSVLSYSVEGKNYSYADTCADEYGVSEGACDNKQWVTQFHSCVNENKICSQGACVTSLGNSSCYDSDGGYNFNTYGSVSYSVEGRSYSYADVCVNEYSLIEAACSNKQWTTQYHSCIADGKICQNGACI